MGNKTKVGLYARVSTLDQSPDMQIRELREYAAARGWIITNEYVDRGVSGVKESRPALNQLMNDARKRKFDCVAVWKFDRFARSVQHLLAALDEFRSLGIQFISYQENIDTTTPLGQAVFTIIAVIATLERDLNRERVRAGLRHARAKGKRLGRPRRIINIDTIEKMRGVGMGERAIARELGVAPGTLIAASRRMRNK
jgi:DNA invertase Pin-like site-specific DNA recombinase